MKKDAGSFAYRLLTLAAILVAALIFADHLIASEPAIEASNQNDTVTVEGTATIYGNWTCKGPANLRAIPGRALEPVPGFPGGIQKAVVEVSVKALECGDGTMNKHMQKALKEKEHPKITFEMDKYELAAGGNKATVFGNLTIAGETRPIEMNVDLQPISGAGERATGKVDIKMKEYGVKPPSLLFGSLKVANDVTVNFNSVVQPPSEAQ